jgi:hypothetical protein
MIWVNVVPNGKSIFLISGLVVTTIISDFITCKDVRYGYNVTEDVQKEMTEMSNYILQNCNADDNIVYFCDDMGRAIYSVVIDTYIDPEIIFTNVSEFERMQTENTMTLFEPISMIVYKGIESIEYIILNSQYEGSMPSGCELVYQNSMYKMFRTNINFTY